MYIEFQKSGRLIIIRDQTVINQAEQCSEKAQCQVQKEIQLIGGLSAFLLLLSEMLDSK